VKVTTRIDALCDMDGEAKQTETVRETDRDCTEASKVEGRVVELNPDRGDQRIERSCHCPETGGGAKTQSDM